VHFGEPLLRSVTHLYTSTLTGFRKTSSLRLHRPSHSHISHSLRTPYSPKPLSIRSLLGYGASYLHARTSSCSFPLSITSLSPSPPPAAATVTATAYCSSQGYPAHVHWHRSQWGASTRSAFYSTSLHDLMLIHTYVSTRSRWCTWWATARGPCTQAVRAGVECDIVDMPILSHATLSAIS
jgi:hypothetical protein